MPQHRLQSTVIRTVGKVYPSGVSLVTENIPNLKYLGWQNRDTRPIHIWLGRIPVDRTDPTGAVLPLDPADWTAQQLTDATTLITDFGWIVDSGNEFTMGTASTADVYVLVVGGSANASIMVG